MTNALKALKTFIPYRATSSLRASSSVKGSSEKEPSFDVSCAVSHTTHQTREFQSFLNIFRAGCTLQLLDPLGEKRITA